MISSSSSLYDVKKIDEEFLYLLNTERPKLHDKLQEARTSAQSLDSKSMQEISLILEDYILNFFSAKESADFFLKKIEKEKEFYLFKRNFLRRYASKKYPKETLDHISIIQNFQAKYSSLSDEEFVILVAREKHYDDLDELIVQYAACRLYYGPKSRLFSMSQNLDFSALIRFARKGDYIFNNEEEPPEKNAIDEANYCIKCHIHNKDSCSKGLYEKNERGLESIKINQLENSLSGCPLKIKISEMIEILLLGKAVASLAIAMEGNPLISITGKRICNDCSKACIYQKQEPVDVPSIETFIFETVINYEYGFEIYYLLTLWNPLSTSSHRDSANNNILVVGSGPAAISLSYFLLRAGCCVIMIDGQKISKIDQALISRKIKFYDIIRDEYKTSPSQGFGGVSYYGITDRWNKENLLITRIILERHSNFKLFGGIKFGSNINYRDSVDLGFDHIALCMGAGRPNIPHIKSITAGNIRFASDFLMSVNSNHIEETQEKPNFFATLPVYIIGGGLTSIDAASQLMKYIPFLAKKVARAGNLRFDPKFPKEDYFKLKSLGEEFIAEDEKAILASAKPDYIRIINNHGGVNILYKGKMENSKAYKLNHEELDYGLKDGFRVVENAKVQEIHQNIIGNIESIEIEVNDQTKIVPCGTLLIASGTGHIKNSLEHDNISVWGDMDPKYHGSVVKAIASAKNGYKKILRHSEEQKKLDISYIEKSLSHKVEKITDLRSDLYKIDIHSPQCAKNFKIGNFYKLQILDDYLGHSNQQIALSATCSKNDILSFYLHSNKKSQESIIDHIKKGAPISLMGPLGSSYKIYKDSSILLLASEVYSFGLCEYAKILKEQGNEVCFVSTCEKGDVALYEKHLNCEFGHIICEHNQIKRFLEKNYDHIHVAGDCEFLRKSKEYLYELSGEKLLNANTTMQCMMGGVCGRCVVKGEGGIKFACASHVQKYEPEIIENIEQRLSQNLMLMKCFK
ncbi:MAG: FAD-dependent oxidoreductase [Rickettsiaceae bacterium]|nr:FAD-dependent oxidoreductase [Rickettsiaceae bacterium]